MTLIESCPLIICTKDAPAQFRRLLASARHIQEGGCPAVVIVDDSSSTETRALNKQTAESLFGARTLYVDATNWPEIADAYVLPRLKRPEQFDLVRAIRLGVPEWNTESTRNVGQIISVIFLKEYPLALNLDDDMIPPGGLFPLRLAQQRSLHGMKINGSPDYSRFEWVQHYVRCIAMRYGRPIPARPSLYVQAVMGCMDYRQIVGLLVKYSDFVCADAPDGSNGLHRFPQRSEFISGGAYLSAVGNAAVSMFPGWYDEDWFWFDAVQRHMAAPANFLDVEITHEPRHKKVLLRKFMEFEERGRILTAVVRDARGRAVSGEQVEEALLRRAAYIADELDFVEQVACVEMESVERKQVQAARERLLQLIEFLKAESSAAYVSQIANFTRRNQIWAEVIAQLAG